MSKTIDPMTYPQRLRKVAWDVLPCTEVESLLPYLDLAPSSPESEEMDHHDSHERIKRLIPLENYIAVYAALSSRVMAAAALRMNDGVPPDPQILGLVLQQFAETAHVGASVVLAQLLDDGVISINEEQLA